MAYLGSTFDAHSIEPNTPFELIPAGKYHVQIVNSEMRDTKGGTGQYLWMELAIIDGPHDNKRLFERGLPHVWGSGCGYSARLGVVCWHESLSEAGTEGAVVDSAANLQQQIGTASGPTHLLGLVHPAVHQEVGRAFGDGRPNPQAGTMTLGVVDHPVGLAHQIAVQCQQRSPQLPR